MSETEDIDTSDEPEPGEGPRFNKQTRIRIALAKKNGVDGEEWTIDEIADYLQVSKRTVKKYLYESEMAQEVDSMLAEKEAQTRLELVQQLKEKLKTLDEVEKKLQKEKKAVPTSYKLKKAHGKIDFENVPNVEADGDLEQRVEVDVPIPETYEEVPNVDDLRDVWREKRQVQEQLEDLLGLESPDELDVSSEEVIDVKYWDMGDGSGDDGLPDQDVIDVESSLETDEEMDGLPEQDVEESTD